MSKLSRFIHFFTDEQGERPKPTPSKDYTVSGVAPIILSNAVAKPIKSLTQYGKAAQSGTPTPSAPVDIACNNGAIKWDVANQRIYTDGTPEVLSVTASGATPQTASVADLYALGNYADEQDIISGAITRKCGVLVLDGAEDWKSMSTAAGAFRVPDTGLFDGVSHSNVACICTHYVGATPKTTTSAMTSASIKCGYDGANYKDVLYCKDTRFTAVNDLKSFLAAQYAAGTPVIVLYPLAEETIEHTTAQHLHTTAGDNVVSITAEVGGIEIKAVYQGVNDEP